MSAYCTVTPSEALFPPGSEKPDHPTTPLVSGLTKPGNARLGGHSLQASQAPDLRLGKPMSTNMVGMTGMSYPHSANKPRHIRRLHQSQISPSGLSVRCRTYSIISARDYS